MYKCSVLPYHRRQQKEVFDWFNEYAERLKKKQDSVRLYVWSNCFGKPEKIFIDGFAHWEPRDNPPRSGKSANQRAVRYRLLPCVIELLEKTPDEPDFNPKEGRYELVGKTPNGIYFKVVLDVVNNERQVWTYHQTDPPSEKKRRKLQKERERQEKVHALLNRKISSDSSE
jgi:hypothetical protein